jgi:hypothetical protein
MFRLVEGSTKLPYYCCSFCLFKQSVEFGFAALLIEHLNIKTRLRFTQIELIPVRLYC